MADIIFSCYIGFLIAYLAVTYLPYFEDTRFKLWLFMNGVQHD